MGVHTREVKEKILENQTMKLSTAEAAGFCDMIVFFRLFYFLVWLFYCLFFWCCSLRFDKGTECHLAEQTAR